MVLIAETGGVEKIFEEISNGRTISSIAREFQVSRNMLSTILNGPEHRTQLRAAQRQGAEQLADAALEIADNVPEDAAAISKARERISVRKWMASAMDPDRWNTTRANQQVQVNISAQHLDALRQVQVEVSGE
jgi:thioesterase domain-containing protein